MWGGDAIMVDLDSPMSKVPGSRMRCRLEQSTEAAVRWTGARLSPSPLQSSDEPICRCTKKPLTLSKACNAQSAVGIGRATRSSKACRVSCALSLASFECYT